MPTTHDRGNSIVTNIVKQLVERKSVKPVLFIASTASIILAVEFGRYAQVALPIPFLLLYVSVVLSGYASGKLAGSVSGVLAAIYVIYAGATGFGPQTLTGGWYQILIGGALYTGTGFLIGRIRDHKDHFMNEFLRHEAKLESEIAARTDELRKSEANYRNILDNMQETFYRSDLEGTLVMASPSAQELLGYTLAELTGMRLAELYANPDDRLLFLDKLEKSGGRVVGHEAPLRHKDGREVWVATNAQYHRDDRGHILGIEGTVRDVSERKRFEGEIVAAKELAEAASRAKSEFLAAMSHELRTPLNAIIGFSEIMANERFGPIGSAKYKEYAADMNDCGTLLLNLIGDILDLSKIEAGVTDLADEKFDLNAVLRAALHIIAESAERKSLRIEANLDGNPASLRGDERALKQVALNLLSNSVKFTGTGGAITVGVETGPDGGHTVTIADTGIGIAAADIPKALEQFGQLGGSNTEGRKGTGLGLPLAKSLTEMHDGTFELTSEPGAGTTVTLRFPTDRCG